MLICFSDNLSGNFVPLQLLIRIEKSKLIMEELVWGCCQSLTAGDKYIKCTKCSHAYHLACLATGNVDAAALNAPAWTCPTCINSILKGGNNDDTPVRFNPNVTLRPSKRQALQSPPSNTSVESTSDEQFECLVRKTLKGEMDGLVSRMESSIRKMFVAEFRIIKDEMREIKESMSYMNDKFEEVLRQQAEVRSEVRDIQAQNDILKSTVKDLNARLNTIEQYARSNNIEIQCVPEKKNENVLNIITKIGEVINCTITPDNVSHCTRVAKLNPSSSRPRAIVAQFNNVKTRDLFMAAAINFNKNKKTEDKLNSSHICIVGPKTPIFITDHLSPANRALHAAARIAAKEKGYKHVWIRGGKIFMRKRDDSDYIIIKNTDQLDNLK